ncbi:hypothetical protein [Sphingomonas aerolata]|uniref:hypothetical protein n=1 Tax=Sphingomonas aerolata TaxID=185951 RepID=UPI002FDFC3C1
MRLRVSAANRRATGSSPAVASAAPGSRCSARATHAFSDGASTTSGPLPSVAIAVRVARVSPLRAAAASGNSAASAGATPAFASTPAARATSGMSPASIPSR